MSELLPIIRRVRRPLVPVDGAAGGADAKPAVAPVKAVPERAGCPQDAKRKEDDGEAAASEPAQ